MTAADQGDAMITINRHASLILGALQALMRQNCEGSDRHYEASMELHRALGSALRACWAAPVIAAMTAPEQACVMECGLRRATTDAMGIAPDADPIAHARDMRDWAERVRMASGGGHLADVPGEVAMLARTTTTTKARNA